MKVAILIPNSKESLRCPNKNRILRKYTLQWIEKEITSLNDSCKVDVYEIRDEKVPVDTSDDFSYSYTINPIFVSDVNEMKDLLKITDEKIIADVFVLLQLTQPARRAGALKEVLNSVQSHPNQLITSYSVVEFESWRIINDCNWNEYTRHTRKGNQLNVYDGAWYCWQSKEGSQIVFNKDNKKRFIKNIDKLIDVDTPEQLRKRFTIPS